MDNPGYSKQKLWIIMRLIFKLIFLFLSNFLSLWLAAYFIKGFEITAGFLSVQFLTTVVIFTAINIFIKPVLKLIFSPFIIVTLGAGLIFINAAILYFLDFYSESVKINGILSLLYATLIISAVHLISDFLAKRFHK